MSYEERLLATITHGIPAGYDAPPSGHLSYEEQLHVWCLLLKNKLAGKITPAHPWDRRPTEYGRVLASSAPVELRLDGCVIGWWAFEALALRGPAATNTPSQSHSAPTL